MASAFKIQGQRWLNGAILLCWKVITSQEERRIFKKMEQRKPKARNNYVSQGLIQNEEPNFI